MSQAADQGVLLVSLGTIAELGELGLSSSEISHLFKHVCVLLHNAFNGEAAYAIVLCQ